MRFVVTRTSDRIYQYDEEYHTHPPCDDARWVPLPCATWWAHAGLWEIELETLVDLTAFTGAYGKVILAPATDDDRPIGERVDYALEIYDGYRE